MAEEITDVDQVDAGLDQVHCPGSSERVGCDFQAWCPVVVLCPNGPRVAGQEFGDSGACHPSVVWSMEQRVRVGSEARVWVAVVKIIGDEPRGWLHDGT